jgi:hypothetical protein
LSLTIILGLLRLPIRKSSSRAARAPGQRDVGYGCEAFPSAIVEDRQDAEPAAASQLVGDEVERPAIVERPRHFILANAR